MDQEHRLQRIENKIDLLTDLVHKQELSTTTLRADLRGESRDIRSELRMLALRVSLMAAIATHGVILGIKRFIS